jgi:hypothetical protein
MGCSLYLSRSEPEIDQERERSAFERVSGELPLKRRQQFRILAAGGEVPAQFVHLLCARRRSHAEDFEFRE